MSAGTRGRTAAAHGGSPLPTALCTVKSGFSGRAERLHRAKPREPAGHLRCCPALPVRLPGELGGPAVTWTRHRALSPPVQHNSPPESGASRRGRLRYKPRPKRHRPRTAAGWQERGGHGAGQPGLADQRDECKVERLWKGREHNVGLSAFCSGCTARAVAVATIPQYWVVGKRAHALCPLPTSLSTKPVQAAATQLQGSLFYSCMCA